MNTQNNVLVAIVMLLVGFGLGYLLTSASKDSIPMEHTMTMDSMMDSMMSGLEGKTGDDFDKAFLSEMIIHHQGAVEMAELVLETSKRSELTKLANDIITAQTKEIEMMQGWHKAWFK